MFSRHATTKLLYPLPVKPNVDTTIFNITTLHTARLLVAKRRLVTIKHHLRPSSRAISTCDATNPVFHFPTLFHAQCTITFFCTFPSTQQGVMLLIRIRLDQIKRLPCYLILLFYHVTTHPLSVYSASQLYMYPSNHRHRQAEVGIHFFESDLGLIAESDAMVRLSSRLWKLSNSLTTPIKTRYLRITLS